MISPSDTGDRDPSAMTLPGTRVLAGLCAMLAVMLAIEWLVPDGASFGAGGVRALPLRPHTVAASGLSASGLPARDTDEWVQAVLARPVFSISRRPPHAASHGPVDPAEGEARLSGIMITRAGRRAIFAPDGGGHALVLSEGAGVNQSTIRDIFPDRVVLASGAVLRPSYDRNRPIPAFQPIQPGFPPNFANVPGFPAPAFVPPGFPPGVPVPQVGADDGGAQPPVPLPNYRGVLNPQRRE